MPKGSSELTAARKEEIIRACRTLYRTKNFKDITLKDIADATSFTRTSIYNYFHTKEEIFLAILEEEYEAWAKELEALKDMKRPSGKKLAEGIARSLEEREMMLKILSMNHYDMEENSREDNLAEFKVSYKKTMTAMDAVLKTLRISKRNREDFLYAFFPFLCGIYPYTCVTEKQREAMETADAGFVYHSVYELTFSFLKQLLEEK